MFLRALVPLLLLSLAVAASLDAAVIYVDTLEDRLDGDGDCSLREAIQAANNDAAVDGCIAGSLTDSILFDVAGTIDLNQGELWVRSNLEIRVESVHSIHLRAGADSRIIRVEPISSPIMYFSIMGAELSGGAPITGNGGALLLGGFGSGSFFSIEDAILHHNQAEKGGAVAFHPTTAGNYEARIQDSRFFDNHAAQAGALLIDSSGTTPGEVTIRRTLFRRNTSSGNAAAIHIALADVVMNRVAVVDCVAGNQFAVEVQNSASEVPKSLKILNTTIARNAATQYSGLRYSAGDASPASIAHTTVYGNRAGSAGGAALSFFGFGSGNGAAVTIRASILTDTVNEPDCLAVSGATLSSQGFNILGDVSLCTSGVAGDLMGVDPQILEVGDFGGSTMTALPALVSPAVDTLAAAECLNLDGAALAEDQRGTARPQQARLEQPPPDMCDIGAMERAPFELQYDDDIFAADFESGTTLAWSIVSP